MQAGNYWECPHCGTRNKGFAAVCLGCSRERRAGALKERARAPDRVRLTRGARWLLVSAFATAAILGFLLVRTFRSPALEAADVPLEEEVADAGRDPVPPQATMPGAPDSGWMEMGAADPGAQTMPADSVAVVPIQPAAGVQSYTAGAAPPRTARRSYSDADLRAIAAARGAAAARDRGYVVGLRQRRVDDLRQRLAEADSADEQAKLRAWLQSAERDLERARRE